jgi:integrase
MRWAGLDLGAGVWTVPGERAKNGDPIVLPVAGPALTALRKRYKTRTSSAWVFPGGSSAGHITQPKKAWNRILANAKLADLRIHDLRRTLGSWLAMSGVSLPAIGMALGHKDPRSTQVYARMQADAVASAVAHGHRAMKAALSKSKRGPVPTRKKHT